MQDVKQEIIDNLKKVLKDIGIDGVEPKLTFPQSEKHGDYSSNIAMAIFSKSKIKNQKSKINSPMELATHIVEKFKIQSFGKAQDKSSKFKVIERIETVAPGFINFWLTTKILTDYLEQINTDIKKVIRVGGSKRIMVEYAHPNTHKEMHIGHMRTLITGEALSRLFEATGNKVFRANYQGDIGPHVAKALYGIQKIMEEEKLTLEEIEKRSNKDKAHFLGEGYIRGNKDYEQSKEEIDGINRKLYERVSRVSQVPRVSQGESVGVDRDRPDDLWNLYEVTRKWSLDYYDEFYTRFYTKFNRLFFESEVSECGKKIVEENVGRVFENDQGTIVLKGEKYGLHTRVFVTNRGYPTYEGKEMCLGFEEYEAFPFDRIIHVVGSEQSGYFEVVFKALEMLDPEKFKGTQSHLSMGMVTIIGMKMSSRTGELLRVDDLIESVKSKINESIKKGKISSEDKGKVAEEIAIGAIKYSVLNVGVGQNVKFDIEKSVALDGNSGPYLQYTYARTQSVLAKAEFQISNFKFQISNKELEIEELLLLRTLYRFPEIIEGSASNMAPNSLTNYLFDLAQKFNLFYQKHPILKGERVDFRLALTQGTGITIKNGLNLLGIEAPDKM